MMSAMDPPLHERVYDGIKDDYLAGQFVPGKRIDIQELATRHRSSKTPVREAAFILVGEGLLTHHLDGGFLVPLREPTELIELLEWHMQLILTTLSGLKETALRGALRQRFGHSPEPSAVSVANHAADIFSSLAEASGNRQATIQVRRLNERLHYSRIAEASCPATVASELARISNVDVANLPKAVRRRVEAYHLKKIDHQRKILLITEIIK
ncbi:GntR family transcriptional regulator [Sphingobium yanoikuyae]|uniref:GntR family transcriptional regulator n=1 Tax=Sphingobium yanoikuyae TaxID=13690 RepID=UPI0022DDED79|nr:GntR family transcriptional regulator [Sphingobium yanoikuyae]WBQ17670.1 GntR family transcriptional regulator [Sphingobium yanoikuyae]